MSINILCQFHSLSNSTLINISLHFKTMWRIDSLSLQKLLSMHNDCWEIITTLNKLYAANFKVHYKNVHKNLKRKIRLLGDLDAFFYSWYNMRWSLQKKECQEFILVLKSPGCAKVGNVNICRSGFFGDVKFEICLRVCKSMGQKIHTRAKTQS